ncbi:MAG: discoidin domain-containing protein [Fimbriimonadaceae bacterium]|nr:discoidin domain-containing protein [Fimbriimonadaceae bacterium]
MRRCLLPLLFAPYLGCAAEPPSEARATAARAAWPAALAAALGCEDAAGWDGGEAVAEPRHSGQQALRWVPSKQGSLTLRQRPLDLSAFNTLSFWLHSAAANGDTFMVIAESQRQAGTLSYYAAKVTVDWTGWKQLSLHFRAFGETREPAGWDQISTLRLAATGWEQQPQPETVWVLDEVALSFDPRPYRPAINYRKYVDSPPATAWLQRLRRQHPRLILLDEQLPALRQRIATDPLCRGWYANVQQQAAALAAKPVRKHELPDGRRLLSISRDVLDRIYHWGLVYRLDGGAQWRERAWQELQAVVNYPDWNPAHYLDTAEMMHAVAIGYDWFYQDWTPAQRQTLREGLWKHGLRLSHASYSGQKAEGGQGWKTVTNNWNFVCNGGSGIAALAVLDELPDEGTTVLDTGFQCIQIPLQHFEPDGAWWEGIGYWGYSQRYLLSYLRALETACGTDFGLVKACANQGFGKSGDFPIYLSSPRNGYFNFADSGSGGGTYRHWAFFYLAARYQNPLYLDYQRRAANGTPEDLIYYEPFEAAGEAADAPLDRHFRGAEVVTLRGSWADPDAVFAGLKAGRNGIAHAHQDLGSFAWYALGEKWVMDLGTEGQTYQGHVHHLPSWHFYRIRAEGHNTLVFNPAEADSQNPRGDSKVQRFESAPHEALAVVDLTDAYRAHARQVTRGFRLFDQRRALQVQDEITAARPSEVWWFSHSDTNTKTTLAADGREAVLERNGKVCQALLLSPAGAQFEVLPAAPLPSSPNPSIQNQNKNMTKLAIHLRDVSSTTISVVYRARLASEPASVARPAVSAIADWKLSPPPPALTDLRVGGSKLPEFTPLVYTYSVQLPDSVTAPPTVTATAAPGVKVEVAAAATIPGASSVRLTTPGGASGSYLLRWQRPLTGATTAEAPVQTTSPPATVAGVNVTASRDDGNLPRHVLDADPETRWSAFGEQEWIAFDFAAPRRLEALQLAWYSGERRRARFAVETSADGRTWSAVWSGESSGASSAPETLKLPQPVTTRYLRLVCRGNTDNAWNSLATVRFLP